MTVPFNAQQALASSRVKSAPFPTFDPASEDREILEAYQAIRDLRLWSYRQDELTAGQWPPSEEKKWDAEIGAAEEDIRGNFAETVAGVVARLSLVIAEADDSSLDVAKAIMENGLVSLYRSKLVKDAADRELVQAAVELVHIDWNTAVADYRRASEHYARAVQIAEAVEALRAETGDASPALAALEAMVETNRDLSCDYDQIDRLMKTLPSDEEEFMVKIDILRRERVGGEALAWLARDSAYLAGWLDGSYAPLAPVDLSDVSAAIAAVQEA